MRLSQFILHNIEAILQEWEHFARSLVSGRAMSIEALRDDAERMLRFIAADMETGQTPQQEVDKAVGHGRVLPEGQSRAAQQHGVARAAERFSLAELVSEYRALRASVTRMWLDAVPLTKESVAQIVRFNEAIDQILAEGVATFTEHLDQEADLFTASIGHDLSNPLSAVTLSARHLLTRPNLADSERAAVERIDRASERLSGMLADLRDFARTRLGGFLVVHPHLCDVGDLVRNVVGEFESEYANRRIAVECRGNQVIVLDVGLPKLDGVELAHALRQMHGREVRLIAYTGNLDDTLRGRLIEAGVDAALQKPVPIPTLLAAVTGSLDIH
jgi:signal transduction histidine kinase